MNVLETGLIYSNPKPHLVSRHAYFPSLAILPDGTMFAGFDLGSAFEAPDVLPHYAISRDAGKTWSAPSRVPVPDFSEPFSGTCRFTCTPDGSLVGIGALWDRRRTEEGLANPETGGFVETFPFLVCSQAGSLTWQPSQWIDAPLRGPFEICSPIHVTRSGDWLWPASTWKDWDGCSELGMQAVVIRSRDSGRSWSEWHPVMDGRSSGRVFWEIKLAALPDGRLLAVCWTHDSLNGVDLPVHYAVSDDEGHTFSTPKSTGLTGQTCTPLVLQDGRILSIYRNTAQPGLWAQLSHLNGHEWINGPAKLLWGGQSHAGGVVDPKFASTAMSRLRFGLPTSLLLPDGTVLAAFWCMEDAVSVIRYFKISID
jgi:hypothetical protein